MTGSPPNSSYPRGEEIPNYVQIDIGAKKSFGEVQALLSIRNILNRDNRGPSPWASRFGHQYPGRSLLASLTLRF